MVLLLVTAVVPSFGWMSWVTWQERELLLKQSRERLVTVMGDVAVEQTRRIREARQLLEISSRIPAVINGTASECSSMLSALLPAHHDYNAVTRATPAGDIICSTKASSIGVNVAARESFSHPMRTRRFQVSQYQGSSASQTPVIVAVLPILNSDSSVRMVLAVSLRLDSLMSRMQTVAFPRSTRVSVLDLSARTLWATGDSATSRLTGAIDQITQARLQSPTGTTVGVNVVEYTLVKAEEKRWRHYLMPIRSDGAHVAWLSIEVPESVLFEAWRKSLWRLSLSALVTVFLTTIGLWRVGRQSLTKDIASLVLVAQELERGNTRVSLPKYLSLSELSVLRDALGHLANSQEERSEMQVQLRQSERMDSLGAIVGSVSHDFNNHIGIILAATDLAMHDAPPESSVFEQLQTIQTVANRSRQITQRVLDFARRAPAPVAVSQTVTELLNPVRGLLPCVLGTTHHLRWDVEAAASLSIDLTGAQLEQILSNLLGNARDAFGGRPNGVVTLHASAAAPDLARLAGMCTDTQWVLISVIDNAGGIPASKIGRIFEPFFSTKRGTGGTGIGLASVRNILTKAGGDIKVSSTEGVGSQFDLWIPRAAASNVMQVKETGGPGTLANEPILQLWLVEDDPRLGDILSASLTQLGHAVRLFLSSDTMLEASEDAATQLPDGIIADWHLLGGSGAEVIAMAEVLEIPWIVSSANPPDHIPRNRLAPKPATASQLIEALEPWLRVPNRTEHLRLSAVR